MNRKARVVVERERGEDNDSDDDFRSQWQQQQGRNDETMTTRP
jgi:hypothetical protein